MRTWQEIFVCKRNIYLYINIDMWEIMYLISVINKKTCHLLFTLFLWGLQNSLLHKIRDALNII